MIKSFTRNGLSVRLLVALVVTVGVVSSLAVGVRSTAVSASHCNQTYFGVAYNNHTFFGNKCPDVSRPFPNTGPPYQSATDGNADSVGYVIPRTSKDWTLGSEALAGVSDKTSFYDRLDYQYNVRGWGQKNWWAKDGAAFVVFSLIGKNPPADRNLTPADWAELKSRLNNPNLTMTLDNNYPLSPNSASIYDSAGTLDFTHFSDNYGNRGPSFVFRLNGNIVGSIERKCANLLGTFSLPQAANQWTINGQSYVDNTTDRLARQQGNAAVTATPGQLLNWDHDLRNNGPNNMDRTVYYNVDRSGFSNGWDATKAPTGNASGPAGALFVNFGAGSGAANTSYRVVPSDGGRTLCQRISWMDAAWNNGGWGSSAWACALVPYNYNLIPSVTGPNGMGSVGSTIPDVTPRVNNQVVGNAAGTTASPPATEWQLKRIEVGPGKTIPMTQQENATIPCTYYRSGGATTCIDKGSGTQAFPATTTTLALLRGEQIGPNTPAGTKICFTLSVRPYSQSTGNNWRHGVPVCITVSKQPKVQVWGSDLRTRGGIDMGTTVISSGGSDKLFGSWVEYGGFSVGSSDGFASGSGLNNGNLDTTGTNSWNKLTFANVNPAGADSYGQFTLPALPDLATQFNGVASGGAINANLGALNSGTYKVGNFTTTGGVIGQTAGKGKTIIIISTGTVTINGDITYQGNGAGGTFTSIGELPQVIIIARTINIANTAKQIDAWLLTTGATGSINTCWAANRTVTAPLNSTVCNNQLTVNGPIVTEHLHLRRTAGSDSVANAGTPAEVFNLRPDAYLWAQARASQSGKAQTVYSVELPPRF